MSERVCAAPADDEELVVRYLRAGEVVLDVMEMTPDVLDGEPVSESGSLVTDGSWYWREDLAHYVSKYHLDLDPEFLDDVSGRRFVMPVMSQSDLTEASRRVIADWSGEVG